MTSDDEDDWPKKRYSADDMPADDGRLGRAMGLVYALALLVVAAAIAAALLYK